VKSYAINTLGHMGQNGSSTNSYCSFPPNEWLLLLDDIRKMLATRPDLVQVLKDCVKNDSSEPNLW
jgi:hypothetical protein